MKNYGAVTDSKDITTKEYVDGGLSVKANIANPTFTGNVSGITKSMIGLSNVDNTSDLGKPISNPTQNALNLKADKSSLSTVATSGNYADLSNKPTSLPASGGTSDLSNALNTISGNECVISKGHPGGALYVNYRGANAPISEYRMCNGVSGSLAHVTAASFNGSASLVGNPTAPTAPIGTQNTQIANTEFVQTAISAKQSGNSTVVSPSQPTSQNVGDTWYRVV